MCANVTRQDIVEALSPGGIDFQALRKKAGGIISNREFYSFKLIFNFYT